jgi:proteic killer suppression protein
MIRNIVGKATQDVYDGVNSRHARKIPRELHDKAMRLLDQLNAAPALEFLRTPPSNRLEKLRGDRTGYWSLRINDQWRIVFRWKDSDALDVEILDYHR